MEDSFAVIIAGSRDYTNYDEAKLILDKVFSKRKPSKIVCGMARGADMIGMKYANEYKLPILCCYANWEKYGKAAGYRRNTEMAKRADALVAFWDGKSPGTKHMIDEARKRNLLVRIVYIEC